MRDRIIDDQIRRQRETFIRHIQEEKRDSICALASSYHDNTPCTIFSVAHGSFNVCVFVQFDGPLADRWVVRIPFPGRVPWIDEKIDSEVATMMYVAEKTTIPVPKVHAWSYEAQSPIGHAFIIMDHVQGTTLAALSYGREERILNPFGQTPERLHVEEQLADLLAQLRGLEFPAIGALGMPTSDSPSIAIRHRPLPIEVALQEAEQLNPGVFFPEKHPFKTAKEYISALVRLGANRFAKTQDPDLDDLDMASRVGLAYYEFHKYMLTIWHHITKSEPFVLMHGDLTLQGNNLLWDDELNLVAVLDWEWCHTVPISCFIPPTWLSGFFPDPISAICRLRYPYHLAVKSLCKSIAARWPQSPLAGEWGQLHFEPYCALVLALLYPEVVDEIFWDFLVKKFYPLDPENTPEDKLGEFLEKPNVGDFLRRRVADQKRYDKRYELYVREHGEPQDCQCVGCEKERNNFDILQELPRL
ncbi:hypothetical protein N0V84_011734 [Fusarium piperis]|uniref:Aminoglycoside phosphotransferase domain-containing protein n=1 Tax=Fusarium piperis TaxID=1435070 RepID=A0A9W8T9Z1_9HYPO|nr:hypothetical protein N0V84_011734 [Fusarium piperis]